MARTGSRAKARERKNFLYIILLIAASMIVIGCIAYFKSNEASPINRQTLCPARGPHGHIVLLVDKSDPMTFTQKKDFDVIYEELVTKRVPKGHLLSVYALGEDFKSTADPLIELCNPGDGSDINIRDGNPEKVAKVFKEKYVKPMLELSVDLVTDKPGKASPLFEMLQLVSITGFRKNDVKGERRLIVVSDMLHNTTQYTMYKAIPKFQNFAATPYAAKAMTDLPGVKVELQILMNTPQLQKPNLIHFWEEYVLQANGKVVAVNPIKG